MSESVPLDVRKADKKLWLIKVQPLALAEHAAASAFAVKHVSMAQVPKHVAQHWQAAAQSASSEAQGVGPELGRVHVASGGVQVLLQPDLLTGALPVCTCL